jgi:hypothetical protein
MSPTPNYIRPVTESIPVSQKQKQDEDVPEPFQVHWCECKNLYLLKMPIQN